MFSNIQNSENNNTFIFTGVGSTSDWISWTKPSGISFVRMLILGGGGGGGAGAATNTTVIRGGGGGGAQSQCLRDFHRRGRRLHHRPQYCARSQEAQTHFLRRDAGDGQPGGQGFTDPLGGIRQEF